MIGFGSLPYLIAFGLAAVLIVAGLCWLAFAGEDPHHRDRVRRMAALRPEAKAALKAVNPMMRKRAPDRARSTPLMRLATLLRQADLRIGAERFATLCAMASALLALPLIFGLGALAGLVAALTLGFGLPLAVVSHKRTKRLQAFTTQLPDALELMVRGLRVGHPLGATIAQIASAIPDPLGSEFRRLAEQIAYGDDLATAFRSLADRVDQEDMHYLAVSVSIQHSTGGNLAQMLSVLARVIRDRIMMRRRVRAISSEGRISATMLSGLPVLIYVATSITAPNYYGGVKDDPAFMPIAMLIVALVVANFFALRKLASFRF